MGNDGGRVMGLASIASMALNWVRLIGKPSHARNVRKSRSLIKKLSSFESNPAVLAYLRKIPPELFEEMILSLFERDGFLVLRNKRYSGDGGIDGRVWIGCGFVPIQCKRYGSHIRKEHVDDFSSLTKKGRGIFVHTGKTGAGSKDSLRGMLLLSGFVLADVCRGRKSIGEWLPSAREMAVRRLAANG